MEPVQYALCDTLGQVALVGNVAMLLKCWTHSLAGSGELFASSKRRVEDQPRLQQRLECLKVMCHKIWF